MINFRFRVFNILMTSMFLNINTFLIDNKIDASKEVGLDVNTEKTKYMLLSRHQNAGQYHNIKIDDRSFENVAQ
jgi:hypothetical protein